MSTTLTEQRHDSARGISGLRLVGRSSPRRPLAAIGSLALILLCAAVFTSLYLHAARRTDVLAVARDVRQGELIVPNDLQVVDISLSPGLSPVPSREVQEVVGRRAAVDLLQGALLTPTDLSTRQMIPRGDVIVGVAVNQGQWPAGGVTPGDEVDVDLTGPPGSLDAGQATGGEESSPSTQGESTIAGGVIAESVVVEATEPGTSGAASIVSVVVPSAIAPLVANASAAGQAAIVLVGARS